MTQGKSETGSTEGQKTGGKRDVEPDGPAGPQDVDHLLKRMYHFTDAQIAGEEH